MDKQARGMLLVEKEELQQAIARTRKELHEYGVLFEQFGNRLREDPSRVVFSNAPGQLGQFPPELMHVPSFMWEKFPALEVVAQRIQDLRQQESRLRTITQQLG